VLFLSGCEQIMDLSIVEGYFGPAWSWPTRTATMRALAARGYRRFIYAPKADPFLRRRWRERHPDDELQRIADFAAACRAIGVRFGIGLTPFEAHLGDEAAALAALAEKLAGLAGIGIDDFALLFDDMKGDLPDLAARQVRMTAFCAERMRASGLIMCPSYYSDDPILDRVFGARPPHYLADLGRGLDPAIDIFWTGSKVCSNEFDIADMERVADLMRRKPFLWDNYPVNDGPRMSKHLHLRGFTGRPAALANVCAGHAINPALQPVLTRIPALTLATSYRDGVCYDASTAFAAAAMEVAGPDLARQLAADLTALQEQGLGASDAQKDAWRRTYAAIDHPAAAEIIDWLDGVYSVSAELVQTQ
jgi:hypothetical protein